MAIKVIRHGTKIFRITCPVCGCEFEYEYEDLQTIYGIAKQIKCPDCGEMLDHREVKPRPEPNPINPLNPYIIWTTNTPGYNLDCATCPNRPDPNKPITVGDTPCTWCKKNQPYCISDLHTSPTTMSVDVKYDDNSYTLGSSTVSVPKYAKNSRYGSLGTVCTDTLRVRDDIDTSINTDYTTNIKE